MNDRENERPMFIAPDAIEIGITPNGQVSVRLGKPHPSLGFSSEIVLALELSPTESRSIGEALIQKAREAEGGRSQH